MSEKSYNAVIIGEGTKWVGKETIIRWEEYPQARGEVSLPKIVDDEAKRLKEEYLSWIHNLSSKQFGKKSLPQRLEIFPGISAWWSSAFAEKSFWKTPEIYDVLRLRALELYCTRSEVKHLTLCVADHRLNEVLKDWCAETGLRYEWQPENVVRRPALWTRLKRKLLEIFPLPIFLLIYIRKNLAFLNSPTPEKAFTLDPDGLTIFTYSTRLDKDAAQSGRFRSLYWDGLPPMLTNLQKNVNWLFLFIPSQLCPNAQEALKHAKLFNQNEDPKHRFFFLEQWLSWRLILKAVFVYYKMRFRTPRAKLVQNVFRFHGSKLNFWPVMKKAWIRSMHGYRCLDNAITLMLFREFMALIPRQDMGICLAEFIGWERSLIQCWHTNGFGRILGYIHCFVSFFDFRFFADRRSYSSVLPRYDHLIVNSQVAWDLLQDNGYPFQEMLKAEALTQSYLCAMATNSHKPSGPKRRHLRLLVLTDYDANVSLEQLKLLGGVLNSAETRNCFSVTIKPHPLLNVDDIASKCLPAGAYEILDLSSSMAEALRESNIVYASNFTTAALDAAFINLPIIISLSGSQINMSPLRGMEGVTFVNNASQLAEALSNPKPVVLPEDFFYLNEDLPLWSDLLETYGCS